METFILMKSYFALGLALVTNVDRCDEIDTLQHKFLNCRYVKEIWRHLHRLTGTLEPGNQNIIDPIKACLAASVNLNSTIATINAEVLQRIMSLHREQDYLVHPKRIIEQALKLLYKRERTDSIKNDIASLLNLQN